MRATAPESRLAWLSESVERDPGNADSQYWLAMELVEDLGRHERAIQCQDRAACVRAVREHAALGERPGDPRVAILESRLTALEGHAREAEADLWRACQRFPGNVGCDEALVTLAMSNSSENLTDAVKRFVASGCANAESCSRTQLTLGNLFARAGKWNIAITHYERAAREAPSPETWGALAHAARQAGNDTQAADAQRRASLLQGRSPRRQRAASLTADVTAAPEDATPAQLPAAPPGDEPSTTRP
jgi:tetratricopeptide (TPR) repeat protein